MGMPVIIKIKFNEHSKVSKQMLREYQAKVPTNQVSKTLNIWMKGGFVEHSNVQIFNKL
jgi:hypothetical protein